MRDRGQLIAPRDWYERCDNFTPKGLFGALIRHDTRADSDKIWGDKLPSYITRITELKEIFPEARFILFFISSGMFGITACRLIRLGVKIFTGLLNVRVDDVGSCIEQGNKLGSCYLQIKYEDLLDDAKSCLIDICDFLGIEYFENMEELSRLCRRILAKQRVKRE